MRMTCEVVIMVPGCKRPTQRPVYLPVFFNLAAMSQSFTVLSQLAVAMVLPSGDQASPDKGR